jgi:hypothetical protein
MDTMSGPATGQMEQYVSNLERHKEQLRRAKAFKGQKPTAAMKRSRQQLESDFANAVGGMSDSDFKSTR